MNILSKSPTYTIPRSHQEGDSHQGSYISSQCEIELSMRQTPKSLKHSPMHMLTKRRSLSRSLDESFDARASYSDSVRTEIIRIPQVPSISEAAGSIATWPRSVNKNNSSANNSVVEHHSSVVSVHCNDNCNPPVSSNPDMPPSSDVSETVSQCNDFTTNEQKLQLHLKQHGFPYRVMRRNVETDLEAGLQQYFELDVLDENNKFICDTCTAQRTEKRGSGCNLASYHLS